MSHGQHTTRRALFVGAAATILTANVAGALAAELFATPDMICMAADGMLTMYARNGVQFVPQPNGKMSMCIDATEDTPYDHDVVSALDKRMKEWPELRKAVFNRVRERYGVS
ncbi:hypothetical protein P7L87_24975 [Vibrio parahaemolyticus]|nr:hypothetical protein [Vibrio parahaemolyticus]